jgi:hypothetical protein
VKKEWDAERYELIRTLRPKVKEDDIYTVPDAFLKIKRVCRCREPAMRYE